MKWINKLERRFGKYGIPNLMQYIVFGMAIVFVINMLNSGFIAQLLFWPTGIFNGQVWRLITFVFIPPSTSPIFVIFVLMFYYYIGKTLESVWGTFKFNVYYFLGVILIVVVGLLTGYPMDTTYLNLSLFLAYATLYPNRVIRLYLIIPVKIKWLAWLNAAFFVYTIIFQPMYMKISAVIGLTNYFIFFGKDLITMPHKRMRQAKRKQAFRNASTRTRQRTTTTMKSDGSNVTKVSFHKCSVCGITELDDPNIEFRYCSKCEGYKEYCEEHLYNHDHH